jgi:hypothetical protein
VAAMLGMPSAGSRGELKEVEPAVVAA